MGGTVAETIRKENGEIIKMARKTGAYNWMFFSKNFNNGQSEKAIDEHVEKFMEMKRDFESGAPYDFPMSPVYGSCNCIAPIEYGLVVIDFKKKKIHSMQDYDTPGQIPLVSFSKFIKTDSETVENYKFLSNNNLLEMYDSNGNYLGDIHKVFGAENTYENIQRNIQDSHNSSKFFETDTIPLFANLTVKSLKGFEIISYEESPEGIVEYLTNLKADGFEFNEEEVKLWKQHYDDFGEYAGNDLTEEELESLSDEDYGELASKFQFDFYKKIDDIAKGVTCRVKKTK